MYFKYFVPKESVTEEIKDMELSRYRYTIFYVLTFSYAGELFSVHARISKTKPFYT